MNITQSRPGQSLLSFQNIKPRPGLAFGIIILTALLAFESFNYSTTDYALRDLLGELRFAGIRWATILSIAFCGIDFAGIARLFTPEQGDEEPRGVWYLFGAWMLAASMNAILTWWGVSMAISNHQVVSSQAVVAPATLTRIVPIFVSIMVWVIRILIIGSLSNAGDRLFASSSKRKPAPRRNYAQNTFHQPDLAAPTISPRPVITSRSAAPARPVNPRPVTPVQRTIASPMPEPPASSRQEPTYHSLSARSARPSSTSGDHSGTRQL